MLRGTNRITDAMALAIESALPFSTSKKSGWRDVTPGRRKMCAAAALAAVEALNDAGFVIVSVNVAKAGYRKLGLAK